MTPHPTPVPDTVDLDALRAAAAGCTACRARGEDARRAGLAQLVADLRAAARVLSSTAPPP